VVVVVVGRRKRKGLTLYRELSSYCPKRQWNGSLWREGDRGKGVVVVVEVVAVVVVVLVVVAAAMMIIAAAAIVVVVIVSEII